MQSANLSTDTMKEMGPAKCKLFHESFSSMSCQTRNESNLSGSDKRFQYVTKPMVKRFNWQRKRNSSQERVVEYSQLQHFKFEEGHLMEALEELRQPWLKGK